MTVEAVFKDLIVKVEDWDTKQFNKIYKSKFSKRSILFAKVFSFFGNMYFWGLVWLSLGVYGYVSSDYYLFILFTAGFDQSLILYLLVRYVLVKRNRPYMKLEGVQRHDALTQEHKSFPSGHVTFFLFFGIVFAFYFREHFWIIFFVFLLLDVVMAMTRLILGAHYPTDVIAGFFFAFLFAFLFLGLTHIFWIEFYYWLGNILSALNPFYYTNIKP